ncbi:TonB-dependent receptor plug domain-containing protein [Microbulbifer elongatus]|uniref:TonB-dependent receptor plug domain-containing protein n=1 Tax=Microbulbifer elongatus TaxID=86173 RepID=UPI001E2AAEA0|nr:TonB-dependent receptor [Microbulbifer elongatus]
MSKVRFNALLTASMAVVSYTSIPTLAQDQSGAEQGEKPDASANVEPMEEVVVIGSNIRGIAAGGASPVISFDKTDIENTGAATMQQFFEKLPQNFAGGANGANVGNLGVDRDTGNNFGQGTSINLRGLGTGTTLTLINGHRVSSSNRYQYVDVSLIPMSAVERVEILTDGASAIYGADAIGGVVNIIMRQDFTGYETNMRYGAVTTGGMNEYQVSQAAGWSWEGGRALVNYEYLGQDNLSALDKDFSSDVAYTPYDLYPASKRHSLYMDGLQQINDFLTLNLSASYADREMDTNIASQWDITNLFPQTRQYDLFAGLTLQLPQQWQARLNAGYGKNEVRYERTTIEDGVAETAPPTDTNSTIAYLDLIADGDLFSLPAGAVRAAVGTSFRRDEYDLMDYRGLEDPYNPSRDISAAFSELNIPLLSNQPGAHNLSLTIAARYDDYSDFGSTTNPKYGVLWEVNESLAFRASYGESFRAPVFTDMKTNNGAYVFSLPNANAPSGRTNTLMLSNGNPDLEPERAETWTGGFTFSPQSISDLTIQANYYQIDYADRIDVGYVGSIGALYADSTDPYTSILTFNPTAEEIEAARQMGLTGGAFRVIRGGPYAVPEDQDEFDTAAILDNRVRNNAETSQRGVDLDVQYNVDVGDNQVGLSLAAWYIIDSTRQLTSTSPESDALNMVYLPVDLEVRSGVTLNRNKVTGGVFLNYVDSYRDPSNMDDPKVDSWATVDMNLGYDFVGETNLTLNIQNVFDEDPPFVLNARGTGYDPTNATALGRFVSLSMTYEW